MAYAAKDFSKLIGMEGFSETLLKNHFTLYQGYVTNTNKLQELLGSKAKDATNPETMSQEIKEKVLKELGNITEGVLNPLQKLYPQYYLHKQ